MRTGALAATLSAKLRDGELLFVDTLSFPAPKTAAAREMVTALSRLEGFGGLATRKKNATFVALGSANVHAVKSFRNFGNMLVGDVRNMNPVDVLRYKYLVMTDPETSIAFLNGRSGIRGEKKLAKKKV